MGYTSKFTGAEIDNLLDKVKSNGGVHIVASNEAVDTFPMGNVASVVQDDKVYLKASDMWQPTAEELEMVASSMTIPETAPTISGFEIISVPTEWNPNIGIVLLPSTPKTNDIGEIINLCTISGENYLSVIFNTNETAYNGDVTVQKQFDIAKYKDGQLVTTYPSQLAALRDYIEYINEKFVWFNLGVLMETPSMPNQDEFIIGYKGNAKVDLLLKEKGITSELVTFDNFLKAVKERTANMPIIDVYDGQGITNKWDHVVHPNKRYVYRKADPTGSTILLQLARPNNCEVANVYILEILEMNVVEFRDARIFWENGEAPTFSYDSKTVIRLEHTIDADGDLYLGSFKKYLKQS